MSDLILLSPGDPSQRTGGYIYNARMVAEWQSSGYAIDVIALDNNWTQLSPKCRHFSELNDIPKGSVILVDGLVWPYLEHNQRTTLLRSCRVWVLMHSLTDSDFKSDSNGLIQSLKRSYELDIVDGWCATSDHTMRLLNQCYPSNPGHVVVPGTDVIDDSPVVTDRHILLSVAHVIPRKGHDRLLQSLADVIDLDWELRIVGSLTRDPSWAQSIQQLAKTLGLADRIVFLGECDADSVHYEFCQADVLLHSALFESYGMVLTEALSRGLPVISTPAGALDTISSPAVSIVQNNAMADEIRKWLKDSQLRRIAREATRSIDFPDWNTQSRKLADLMGLKRTHFDVDWLRLREPYDHAARSDHLLHSFFDYLSNRNSHLLDLATGTGSSIQYVYDRIPNALEWSLVDYDPKLLNPLRQRMLKMSHYRFATFQMDLNNMETLPKECDGVMTQAFLDLVSFDWLNRFVTIIVENNWPLLASLTVNGKIEWSIHDGSDHLIYRAFTHHQTWDHGFGEALGTNAVSTLTDLLGSYDYKVDCVDSDWVVPAEDTDMIRFMIMGMYTAASDASDALSISITDITEWRDRRLKQLGQLSLVVGHFDLFARPI